MKRRYESSSSSSREPPRSKFKGDRQVVADHYSARPNRTVEEREYSPIIQLKKLNNWIKSVLIQLYARPGDAVLDLACGKGGDLFKWDKANIGYYVGIDIAQGSIDDFRRRYNGGHKRFRFPARLFCGDCFEAPLDQILADNSPFDICSCQFAMHYSWSTEARARQALVNVSALLRPGGIFIGTMPDADVIVEKLREAKGGLTFGNSVYSIKFDEAFSEEKFKSSNSFGIKYEFHLEDAVDCPEWLVNFDAFTKLAEECGLELVFMKNNQEFVKQYMKEPRFVELMRKIGGLGYDKKISISSEEREAANLYLAFVLKKKGQSGQTRLSARRDKGKTTVEKADVTHF